MPGSLAWDARHVHNAFLISPGARGAVIRMQVRQRWETVVSLEETNVMGKHPSQKISQGDTLCPVDCNFVERSISLGGGGWRRNLKCIRHDRPPKVSQEQERAELGYLSCWRPASQMGMGTQAPRGAWEADAAGTADFLSVSRAWNPAP